MYLYFLYAISLYGSIDMKVFNYIICLKKYVTQNNLTSNIILTFIMNYINLFLPKLILTFTYLPILPEIILIISLIMIIILDLVNKGKNTILLHRIFLISTFISMGVLFCQWTFFVGFEHFNTNNFNNIFRFFLLICSLLSVLLSVDYILCSKIALAEFSVFKLTAGLGGMILSCANDLITIYVSLEFLSLSSCFLSGYTKRDVRSNEASMKFLLMSGVSSSSLLYGFSSLYGLSGGQLQLDKTVNGISFSQYLPIVCISVAFILAGTAFKLALFPFHQWTPDVYEGVWFGQIQ